MKRFTLIPILAFFAFLVPSREIAFAEGGIAWDPQGMPVCEASENQWNMRMAPDGSGGAIIVWQDYRITGYCNIYAQRIDSNGNPVWDPNGVIVSTVPFNQEYPVVVGDGYGGAFIAWEDYRDAPSYPVVIYTVRISSDSGVIHPAWTGGNEVKLKDAFGYEQLSPEIVSDGQGGAVVVWEEKGGGNYKIPAQKIDEDGNLLWGAGVGVGGVGTADRKYPKIIDDGQGYVIVTWQDQRNGNYDIYAQRRNINTSSMDPSWDFYGSTVTIAGGDQVEPQIVADGDGGAIITWTDYRQTTTEPDIYAQRISSGGAQVWAAGVGDFDGVPICTKDEPQRNPVIVNNLVAGNIEGAIIMWEDMRDTTTGPDIYAEGIGSNNPPVLDDEDIFIAGGFGPQLSPRLVSDDQGGAIGTSIDNGSKIFAQKRGQYGQPVWSSYPGVLVCEGTGIIIDSQIISDGSGGAIVAWVGFGDSGDLDIFAQRVTDDTVMWISVPISGRVTLSDGVTGITGVEIEALEDGESVSSVTTDTNGDYELAVVAGSTYTVRATWMYNGIESSVSMKAFAPSYYFDFTLEIYSLLGTIAGNVSGVEDKYVASFSLPELKRISNSGLQKILSPGSGIAFVELEQRDKVIVKVPVEMKGDYSIPNLLPGRFIARAYNGTIYSNPRTVNLKEGETFKVNFVFGTIPKETVFNYPNPAKSGSTTIRYYCGYSDPEAEIKIYNIAGELVKKVRDSEIDDTDAPIYKFLWDCKNDSGKEIASSIYIYIVEVKEKSSGETKKVIKRLAVIR